ncbi:hypothetical protein GCM10028803_54340 [Larkinella knui]|uniref:hypothetical protein n=1 Tax=Larkinella knui TaxID=2025310 RepID=UPI0016398644|nr:hypothetical protein [Larkinella knui]
MTRSDVILLVKKIAVGILVTLLPFLILFWGLRLTQKVLDKAPRNTPSNHP